MYHVGALRVRAANGANADHEGGGDRARLRCGPARGGPPRPGRNEATARTRSSAGGCGAPATRTPATRTTTTDKPPSAIVSAARLPPPAPHHSHHLHHPHYPYRTASRPPLTTARVAISRRSRYRRLARIASRPRSRDTAASRPRRGQARRRRHRVSGAVVTPVRSPRAVVTGRIRGTVRTIR